MSEQKKRRGRIENLTPWKPGQSGNPGGYSHKRRFANRLHEILDRKKGSGTLEEAVCEEIIVEALNGNVQAFVAIRDSTDGKPTQSIEHSGPEGGPIPITLPDVRKRIAELLAAGGYREPATGTASGDSPVAGTGKAAEGSEPTS